MRTILRRIVFSLGTIAALAVTGSGVHAQQAGLPTMFSYQPSETAEDTVHGVPATFNLAGLSSLPPGSKVDFTTPDGRSYVFVFDKLMPTKSGNTHWVAHLDINAGRHYRAVITWGNAGFGHISTPDGRFKLETVRGIPRLVDLKKSQRRNQPFGNDTRHPRSRSAPVDQGQSNAASATVMNAVPSGMTQIDVMVLYTNSWAALVGASVAQTRIEHLIGLANQAYLDSQVNLQLNLVFSGPVAYANTDVDTALNDLSNGTGIFGTVANLRSQYGADLVAVLKEFDTSVDPSSCGVAWLNGAGGRGASWMSASDAFAAVNDGNDIRGTGRYCDDFALAHEFGHTMGSDHDRAHGGGQGVFPYSNGYGVRGIFGTIMSYVEPTVGKFSNPAVMCAANLPCGISETSRSRGANNALSFNNVSAVVAAFVPSATNGAAVTTTSAAATTTTTTATTTTATTSTTTVSSTTTTTLSPTAAIPVVVGWNLLGNGNSGSIDVGVALGDPAKVVSVWKWVAADAKWAFYTPQQADGGAAIASKRGFVPMTAIDAGEGFWVNATQAFAIDAAGGNPVTGSSFQWVLAKGWNLIAIGETLTPRQFSQALSAMPPSPGKLPVSLTTLWTWDARAMKWYFYAPSMDELMGTALPQYLLHQGYLDFTARNRLLGPGVGFWVNSP